MSGAFLLRRRSLLIAWSWFLLPLLPVSNVIPIGTIQADRYLYLPVLGATIFVGWTIERVLVRSKPTGIGLGLAVLGLFVALAIDRNRDWRDDLSLWRANVADYPDSPRAHANLGAALGLRGDPASAAREYRTVLALRPGQALASYNLGVALEDLASAAPTQAEAERLRAEAEAAYRTAAAAERYPRGVHERLGFLLVGRGEVEAGVEHLRRALPKSVPAYLRLADLAREAEDRAEEIRLLEQMLATHPFQWEGMLRLAELYAAEGRQEEARRLYSAILSIDSIEPAIRRAAEEALGDP